MPATPAVRARLYRESLGWCAMPTCFTELRLDGKNAQYIAQAAHIVGEKQGSARFDPGVEERNAIENLILMCPTHHDEIDADEELWTVEKLRVLKAEHERNMYQVLLAGRTWQQKFVMVDYVNVPRICGMPGGGLLQRACRDAGLTGDMTFRDLTYQVGQIEGAARRLLQLWEARATPLDELKFDGIPNVVGTIVSFEATAYTRNGRTPEDSSSLAGDLERDPHIWFKAAGRRVSVRYDPAWVTTSTAFANFGGGRGRFAGIGVVVSADERAVIVSALALGLPMRPADEPLHV